MAAPEVILHTLAGADEARRLGELLAAIDPWRRLGYSAEGLERGLVREDAALARHAIEVDGVLAGVVCVRSPWLRGAYVETIGVGSEWQGRGVGAAVMDRVEERARAGGPNLWLCVTAWNEGARRFYARRGFVEVAPLPDLVKAGVDEILMRKRLR